ncbi:YjcZ family sporulation protein [Bacillus sp. JJ1562]
MHYGYHDQCGFQDHCGFGYGGFGYNNSFVLIVVLFILLIIVGASFVR